ncbi:hypothetical protein [Marinitoga sp. 1138]|uniref:hypothetical protein n=1 Tax=Marinitoga sp. 1138 TaxID=1643334 RepID=UPI0015863A69|nr:hypothetical protein [Marinitoga sp. 1138]NUU98031.1 hypothetical protein [Marinitoga sp. 1138]
MKLKNIYLLVFIFILLFSGCTKPAKSKFEVNVEISYSSESVSVINKSVSEANESITLKISSPLADIGSATLKIEDMNNTSNIKSVNMTAVDQYTYTASFKINEAGKYKITGIFLLGGDTYESNNSLILNIYDYQKELNPNLKFKNIKTNEIIDSTELYDPYRYYTALVSFDNNLLYNSDFTYKIYFDSNLIESGSLKNKTFESTPMFFENKKHTISVEVYDTQNNGFGRTTVEVNPKNIDTTFNFSFELHKDSFNGDLVSKNSTLTTNEPLYALINLNEKYDLPASYTYKISTEDTTIESTMLAEKSFKYGPFYLKDGDINLNISVINEVTEYSTEIIYPLKVKQFDEFDATLEIYKKDYMNKNILITDDTTLTTRDPIFFKIRVNKNYDFSNDLKYQIILKKDGKDYKEPIELTSNATELETNTMFFEKGSYELDLTIIKEDTKYTKKYYKYFRISEVINNFELEYTLEQKKSDGSIISYFMPEEINVVPLSDKLNEFNIKFNLKTAYTYPATYVYTFSVNGKDEYVSEPIQTRTNTVFTSYKFPSGHNLVEISVKDVDNNFEVKKYFEVLVKEDQPPDLYRVTLDNQLVYSYDPENNISTINNIIISTPTTNPIINIEFIDESFIKTRSSLTISVKVYETNKNYQFSLLKDNLPEGKKVGFYGVLEGITLDSTQTWEIKIDSSQIVDEFDNSKADKYDSEPYSVIFKTK